MSDEKTEPAAIEVVDGKAEECIKLIDEFTDVVADSPLREISEIQCMVGAFHIVKEFLIGGDDDLATLPDCARNDTQEIIKDMGGPTIVVPGRD